MSDPNQEIIMEYTPVCRYANKETAMAVIQVANRIYTKHRLRYLYDKCDENDSKRGVGDHGIVMYNVGDSWLEESHRAAKACADALTLVLADKIKQLCHDHPLIQSWWLKEENRDNLYKYG